MRQNYKSSMELKPKNKDYTFSPSWKDNEKTLGLVRIKRDAEVYVNDRARTRRSKQADDYKDMLVKEATIRNFDRETYIQTKFEKLLNKKGYEIIRADKEADAIFNGADQTAKRLAAEDKSSAGRRLKN